MNLAAFSAKAAELSAVIARACARFEINSALRQAHFLAQCAHESAGFTRFTENLNYGADRLLVVFPKYFKNIADALPFDRKPENIANRVYANRNGNGDEASGDGFRFCGRGMIQITGRANYTKASQALYAGPLLATSPELVEQPFDAALTAAWFWGANNLNALADADDLEAITRKVNGGLNGLEDRRQWLDRAKAAV